jgi:hypothetical protein
VIFCLLYKIQIHSNFTNVQKGKYGSSIWPGMSSITEIEIGQQVLEIELFGAK